MPLCFQKCLESLPVGGDHEEREEPRWLRTVLGVRALVLVAMSDAQVYQPREVPALVDRMRLT